jgi:hypothetical protein
MDRAAALRSVASNGPFLFKKLSWCCCDHRTRRAEPAKAWELVQVQYALTMHSLCTRYALTTHSLYTHYTLTTHSLYTHYHYTLTIQALVKQGLLDSSTKVVSYSILYSYSTVLILYTVLR